MFLDIKCLRKFMIAIYWPEVAFVAMICSTFKLLKTIILSVANSNFVHMNLLFMDKKEFPAPFATKIYYSQRSHRLRSAISNLYKASTNEHCSELLVSKGVKGLQENALLSQTSSSRNISHEEFDDQLDKVCYSFLSANYNGLFHLGILSWIVIFSCID